MRETVQVAIHFFLRSFQFVICNFVLGALVAAPKLQAAESPPNLEQNFLHPPASSRPRTLWMWMNGNVSSNGIARDLESMKRVGLGGAMIFNVGEYIPKGPVDYGKSEWLDLMRHAAGEANRVGLELGMHNCPGWSSSGGPWITPEMSMQQLVWSETRIAGGGRQKLNLP